MRAWFKLPLHFALHSKPGCILDFVFEVWSQNDIFLKLQVTHRQTSRCIETQSMSTLNPHSRNGVLGPHEPNIVLPWFNEAPEIRFSCRSSVYNQTLTDTTPWFRRTCRQIKVLQHAARGASNSAPRRDSLPCNDYTSIYKHCAKHTGYSGGSMFNGDILKVYERQHYQYL